MKWLLAFIGVLAIVATGVSSAAATAMSPMATHQYDFISNTSTKLCMAAVDNSVGIYQEPCQRFHEQWNVTAIAPNSKWFHLINANTLLCVGIQNNSTADGGKLIQMDCGLNANNEEWEAVSEGSGGMWPHYAIINRNSNKCVGVPGGVTTPNVGLIQYHCPPLTPNMIWQFEG